MHRVELRFFEHGYGAALAYQDHYLEISFGRGNQQDHYADEMVVVELKRLGIEVIGGSVLYQALKKAMPESRKKFVDEAERITLDYVAHKLQDDPGKFVELVQGLAKERYEAGWEAGVDDLRSSMRKLLGL